MTTTAIRERLYDYIRDAEDKKVEAIYTLLEDQIVPPPYEWSEDEEFVAELEDRMRRVEEGIDKGVTLDELKAELAELKMERLSKSQ